MTEYKRRHSRLHERVLFSSLTSYLLGFFLVVFLPPFLRWGTDIFQWLSYSYSPVQFNSTLVNALAFTAFFISAKRIGRFPGSETLAFLISTPVVCWLLGLAVLLFTRQEYSRYVLGASFIMSLLWALLGYYLTRRYRRPKLAIVPFGRAKELLAQEGKAQIAVLKEPDLGGRRYDAVVADLHAEDLPPEWERFLARCTLSRIPVYHFKQVVESLSGRVKIDHLAENEFGALLPSPVYEFIKRLLDLALVLGTLPVWLPVMLITGVIIKLESEGPMFFIQERVGQGGQTFRVYKLRSMCKDSEKDGAQFASANDMRITRVGKFIRKTRIDEIPQFLNVLKGDMSLVGPRPEQRVFVEQFNQEIPFYMYRHVVKPGITGWAQVVHGYAADADDTRVKIEHDFYYIKHFSFWLDMLIILKTIRTILTGFGAR